MHPEIKLLKAVWYKRLVREFPDSDRQKCQSILDWLLSYELDRQLAPNELGKVDERLKYRYRILRERYLYVDSHKAYSKLISRLGSVLLSLNSVQIWITKQPKHRGETLRLIQKLVHELLDNDFTLQQRLNQISRYTTDSRLSKALILATIEEYCLYPIYNQPLLIHLLRQYLQRQSQEEMSKVA